MAQDATDLRTLVDAEKVKRNKERLSAARKLANKKSKSTERERILQRVRGEQRRTGAKLLGKPAPRKVRRGKSSVAKKTGANRTVIQKTPTAVINVLRGSETREKVRKATE